MTEHIDSNGLRESFPGPVNAAYAAYPTMDHYQERDGRVVKLMRAMKEALQTADSVRKIYAGSFHPSDITRMEKELREEIASLQRLAARVDHRKIK